MCDSALDVSGQVRSTLPMRFFATHVMCQLIDTVDMKKHRKYMARQRCVGASGNSTD
jgi:hypothetical protein